MLSCKKSTKKMHVCVSLIFHATSDIKLPSQLALIMHRAMQSLFSTPTCKIRLEIIPELIARWKDGAEVVYAQRAKRKGETFFKLATAAAFYRLIQRITAVNIPSDTGDFRLLDRQVVDTLVKMREHHRFMRGLSAWVGFRQDAVLYERHERFAGTTKYPLTKMIRFSLDAITSFSHVPLQIATSLGFGLALVSLIGILIAIILRLFTDAIVGQATTLIMVLFMGGIQLIFLGIIGEYLGRIYDEVRARPLYIVRKVLD